MDTEATSARSVRTFKTGATRDTEAGKPDFEGFLSPLVIQRFGEYMHENRQMKDGTLRNSDNWQRGIDKEVYIKSLLRHVMSLWYTHRYGQTAEQEPIEAALCAILFNTQGYLQELLLERKNLPTPRPTMPTPRSVGT